MRDTGELGFSFVEMPLGGGRLPETHETERHCPKCETRLSKYNPGPFCYAHRPFQKPSLRGKLVSDPGGGGRFNDTSIAS